MAATVDPNQRRIRLRTARRLYRVDRGDISFLRFILEAYDGMAVVTTRDAARGIVSITMAPGCESLVTEIVATLAADGEIYIEPVAGNALAESGQEFRCTSFT